MVVGIVVLVILASLLLALLILIFAGGILVNVGGQEVGIIERRFFGQPLPEGRIVAMAKEIGVQARVLQPGLHVLPPFIYRVQKDDMLVVAEDQVGLVESIDGQPLDPGRIFARHVDTHDTFQDGEAFLRSGGQRGPQVDVLPPGKYRINTYLFHVRTDSVVTVAPGQVGVVSARDGDPIRPGRLLAHKTEGHQAFQKSAQLFVLTIGWIAKPGIEHRAVIEHAARVGVSAKAPLAVILAHA